MYTNRYDYNYRDRRKCCCRLMKINKSKLYKIYIILSVYSPFSDRVGFPLYNIISPFLSIMDIFSADLKFCHIRFNTLTMSFLVFCLVVVVYPLP